MSARKCQIAVMMAVCWWAAEAQAEPLDFAFSENGGWLVTHQNSWGSYRWSPYQGILKEAAERIEHIYADGGQLIGAGFDGDNGYVLVYKKDGQTCVSCRNIFKTVAEKIKEIRNDGGAIQDVGLTPDRGYAIIYKKGRRTYWTYNNIPDGAHELLKKLDIEDARLTGIGFTPNGGWAIAYKNESGTSWHYRSQGIPEGAAKLLEEKY